MLGRTVFAGEIPEHPLDLGFRQIHDPADFGHLDLVLPSVEQKVENLERHSKEPLFVRDRGAVGIRARGPTEDLGDDAQVFGQLENLVLVEVGYRLDVDPSIAVFDKKPLDRLALMVVPYEIVELLGMSCVIIRSYVSCRWRR
jgi:hypothetical protein